MFALIIVRNRVLQHLLRKFEEEILVARLKFTHVQQYKILFRIVEPFENFTSKTS